MAETIGGELKQQKTSKLTKVISSIGWNLQKEIGEKEILLFLNKNLKDGQFDNTFTSKLFQFIGIDENKIITVEEFINLYVQFEEQLNQSVIELKKKITDEKNLYNSYQEQCFKYKDEKLNSEGFSEKAKLSMEITDIEIKKKLRNVNEIILSLIYNNQQEELKFDYSNDIIQFDKEIFEFNSTSKKDNFELILQGIENNENIENNQIIIIGKKDFPLEEIISQDEYIVQITIPEFKKKDQIAALINSKITLHWSDYQFFDEKKKNSENKLRKLNESTSKLNLYLSKTQSIYDLSPKNNNSENVTALKGLGYPYDSNFNNYETLSGMNEMNDFYPKEKESQEKINKELNNIYGSNNIHLSVGYEEAISGYDNEVNISTKNANRNSYKNLKGIWLIELLSLLCILFGLFNSLQRADYSSAVTGIICFSYIFYVDKKNLAIKSKRFWHLFLLVFGAMIFDCIWLYFNLDFLGPLSEGGGDYDNAIRRLSYFTTGCNSIIKCCLAILMFAQYKLNY